MGKWFVLIQSITGTSLTVVPSEEFAIKLCVYAINHAGALSAFYAR